jgi:hypothetical protein
MPINFPTGQILPKAARCVQRLAAPAAFLPRLLELTGKKVKFF